MRIVKEALKGGVLPAIHIIVTAGVRELKLKKTVILAAVVSVVSHSRSLPDQSSNYRRHGPSWTRGGLGCPHHPRSRGHGVRPLPS